MIPYSPDIDLPNFYLLPKTKGTLKERRFTAMEDIKSISLKDFTVMTKIELEKCFGDWKKRWHKCSTPKVDYFKGEE